MLFESLRKSSKLNDDGYEQFEDDIEHIVTFREQQEGDSLDDISGGGERRSRGHRSSYKREETEINI